MSRRKLLQNSSDLEDSLAKTTFHYAIQVADLQSQTCYELDSA